MPVYIIFPKENKVSRNLDTITTRFTAETRQRQLNEVSHLYQEDLASQEISHWMRDVQGHEQITFLSNPDLLSVTGAQVVIMSDDEAEKISQELPKAQVLKDQPIQLIQPARVTASFKQEEELDKKSLWHLDAIAHNNVQDVSGKGVTVAILDTGVDSSHPALRGKIDASCEFDLETGKVTHQPISLDSEGHGTHVAGLICGQKIGIAPDSSLVSGVMLPKGRAVALLLLYWP